MFTGIVSALGVVQNIRRRPGVMTFSIRAPDSFSCDGAITLGESICINGVCLTVTDVENGAMEFTAVFETLRRSNLFTLVNNELVNLERSLMMTSRMGGHYVQGHVDGVAEIVDVLPDSYNTGTYSVKIDLPVKLSPHVVFKGYVTLDGMSLTVTRIARDWFSVCLIPYTRKNTVAQYYTPGKKVNVEVDILSKYIEKQMKKRRSKKCKWP